VVHLDFVGNRLLWLDSRQATLNAYLLTTGGRETLHTFLEYPRHPAGLVVFEVYKANTALLSAELLD